MEQQVEDPTNGGEYSGDASGSALPENGGESPPRPFPSAEFPPPPAFPHRFPEYSQNYAHEDRFAAATNSEDSPVLGDDAKSCFVVAVMFSFFAALTLSFGVYASETLRLGPNASILIKPNRLFVETIKVEELDVDKGAMLYGFYKSPPLDVVIKWSESHKTTLPASTHKEWRYYLNEGSQINISYSVNSLSSSAFLLVIAQGHGDLSEWLQDPLYPNTTLSWNIVHGNGSIQQNVSKSSSYYIAVGNLNSEDVEVHLNFGIKASLYNTTEPYYKCAPAQGQCNFKLYLGGNVAVLTSPGRKPGMISSGDWHVEISYGPRWITYMMCIGGMTVLVLLVNYFSKHCQETRRDQIGDVGSERNPLLLQKDDNISGSSYASSSGDEECVEDSQAGGALDSQRLCAICFDAPKDCFFLPCGHCVACFGCATRIVEASGTCPICRRRTKKVRKIYTV